MNCDFTDPTNLGTEEMPDWEYSKVGCIFTEQEISSELIENSTTGAEFYLDKRVSYGEVLVLTFLMLFLVFGILKFLTDFLIPKFSKKK